MDTLMQDSKRLALEYMGIYPEKWTLIEAFDASKGFMYTNDKAMNQLMDHIDKYSGYIHSGASISAIVRFLWNEQRKEPRNVINIGTNQAHRGQHSCTEDT